jgi:hypothetical protein
MSVGSESCLNAWTRSQTRESSVYAVGSSMSIANFLLLIELKKNEHCYHTEQALASLRSQFLHTYQFYGEDGGDGG